MEADDGRALLLGRVSLGPLDRMGRLAEGAQTLSALYPRPSNLRSETALPHLILVVQTRSAVEAQPVRPGPHGSTVGDGGYRAMTACNDGSALPGASEADLPLSHKRPQPAT